MRLEINNSLRQAFKACPRKAYWSVVAGVELKYKRMPLMVGTAFHLGLEIWRKTKGSELEAVAQATASLANAMAAAGTWSQEAIEDETAKVTSYLLGYFRVYSGDLADIAHWRMEERLADGLEHGTLDAFYEDGDGTWIVDDKTRADLEPEVPQMLVLEEQLLNYATMLEDKGKVIAGAIWRETQKARIRRRQVAEEIPMTPEELAARPPRARKETKTVKRLETAKEFGERLMEEYVGPTAQRLYRETKVRWSPDQKRVYRALKATTDAQIRASVMNNDVGTWPYNSQSCIGPYGACDFLNLCTGAKDAAAHFKPKENPLDGGLCQQNLWPTERSRQLPPSLGSPAPGSGGAPSLGSGRPPATAAGGGSRPPSL